MTMDRMTLAVAAGIALVAGAVSGRLFAPAPPSPPDPPPPIDVQGEVKKGVRVAIGPLGQAVQRQEEDARRMGGELSALAARVGALESAPPAPAPAAPAPASPAPAADPPRRVVAKPTPEEWAAMDERQQEAAYVAFRTEDLAAGGGRRDLCESRARREWSAREVLIQEASWLVTHQPERKHYVFSVISSVFADRFRDGCADPDYLVDRAEARTALSEAADRMRAKEREELGRK